MQCSRAESARLVYGSETWAMKVHDMRRLERVENTMLRWMYGVTLRDRKRTAELMDCLGVVIVDKVVSRRRLRQYEHVEGKDMSDWVSACRELQVEGSKGKVRGMYYIDVERVCEG